MEFCEDCNNMLYLDINNDEESGKSNLIYKCRKCNKNFSNIDGIKNNCVYKIDYNIDKIKRDAYINKYTSLDITLPRINIKCPNNKCTVANPEIVYVRYDNENMKHCYICCECQKENRDFFWFLD